MEELSLPAGFEKIWERVIARDDSLPEPICERSELEKFIKIEREILAQYAKILEKCASKERAQIAKMAANQRQIMRALQLEYFIKSGDIVQNKSAPKARTKGTLSSLRELYCDECDMISDYITASENRKGDLAEIYREIAEEKTQRIREIKAMIKRNM